LAGPFDEGDDEGDVGELPEAGGVRWPEAVSTVAAQIHTSSNAPRRNALLTEVVNTVFIDVLNPVPLRNYHTNLEPHKARNTAV
jgi:hypothetical protein